MISHPSTFSVFLIITFAIYVDSECVRGQIVAQVTSKRFDLIDSIRKSRLSYLLQNMVPLIHNVHSKI
jgi:hypothetical protein